MTTIILVLGHPSSGKTTLAQKIATPLNLPFISRDEIKLMALNVLGWRNRDWSKKIGEISYEIMYYMIEEQLKAKHPFIVESNFAPELANERFQKWQKQYNFECIQILCYADKETLLNRWKKRSVDDKDHPSYTENREGLRDLEETLKKDSKPLDLLSKVIKVDTTDFSRIDEPGIIDEVKGAIH